ncbi:MAG: tetratricopeptide repeat protein, partial [Candidatus Eisenbacteria bacterium]
SPEGAGPEASLKARRKNPNAGARSATGIGLVLLAALILRLVYLWESRGNPFFDQPVIDAAEYFGWARTIAGGEWLWTRVHIHGPGYPYLLAILIRLGGSFGTFYLVQHLLGAAILFLLYDTGRVVAGRSVGLAAAVLAVLYPRFLFLESLLLAETLATFLNLLLLRAAAGLATRPARPLLWAAVGMLAGLSAATRPTILAVLPVLLYWAYRSGPREEGVRRAGAVLAGVVLLVAPVFLRNAEIGDPVLIQANGGMNFYIGNRAGADGLASVAPGTEWNAIERIATEAGAFREVDRDRYYYRKTLEEMGREPLRAAGRAAKRFLLFWGGWEVEIGQDFDFYRERSGVLKLLFLPAAILAPLALYGVLLALRAGWTKNLPLLVLLSYLAAVLPFPYASRYRMPVFPVHILFAAAALLHLAGKERSLARWWKTAGALAALFLVLNLTPISLPEASIVRVHLHLGKMLYDRGDPRGALAEYDLALDRDPESADVWNNVGLAREELGDTDGALEAYRRALRFAPDHGKARANLAGIYFHRGEADSALAEMRRAVEAEPRNPEFLNNLGALQLQGGALREALETLERGAGLAPRNREVLFNLGRAYERANRFEDADRVFRRLVSIGETKEIRLQLGYVAEKLGRPETALAEYRRALEIDSEYPDAQKSLGVFLLRAGNKREGIPLLERYLEHRPSDGRIRELLRRAKR